jgi:hypothetical protein
MYRIFSILRTVTPVACANRSEKAFQLVESDLPKTSLTRSSIETFSAGGVYALTKDADAFLGNVGLLGVLSVRIGAGGDCGGLGASGYAEL